MDNEKYYIRRTEDGKIVKVITKIIDGVEQEIIEEINEPEA